MDIIKLTMTANWYPGKKPIESIDLKNVPRDKKKNKNQVGACPICDDKGLIRDGNTDEWRKCATGPPWHNAKE